MNSKISDLRFLAVFFTLCIALSGITAPLFAQQKGGERKVSGKVLDETREAMIGVNITVSGTTIGTVSDLDGNFSLSVPNGKTVLQFSFIGYETQSLQIPANNMLNVKLQPQAQTLSDVVVIGYGSQKKSDLTGSVSDLNSKDFNGGLIGSPEQLINGKVAGVQIMSNSGSPTSGSTIRIRGGASLNASNDPLIVLDGVPLESGGISGNSGNFLSLINPNDIESITVLKDASSTAIYGSRASNGVIIISTKKGSGDKIKVSYSSTQSIQTKTKLISVLSPDQFRDLINEDGTTAQKALLGDASTVWNDEIFHPAFGTDNNLSVSGKIGKYLPFRVSTGYYSQDGLLKTDNAERFTESISLTPSFFDNHLKVNFNVKGSYNNNTFASTTAIWNAAAFNPTQPVYSGNTAFGGYYESLNTEGIPATGALLNPVGLLNQDDNTSTVKRMITNLDVDYKLHFLPELKAHVTLGYDYAKGEGSRYIPETAAYAYKTGGTVYDYSQTKMNKLLTTYLNYTKMFDAISSNVDATVGYDYQYWHEKSPLYVVNNVAGEAQSTTAAQDQKHVLISFYGRLNYSLFSKYMLTATVRKDGTSRFNKDNRWGTFPSVALAWRVSEEEFLKDSNVLSNLKLRVSYGVTAQQEGIGNYSYMPIYTLSNEYAQYPLGNTYYKTYRPKTYVSDLKWETTNSYNAGFDFGFLKNRISGSFDYYSRKTKDLLATVSVAAGTNFSDNATTNIGNIKSHGLEFSLSAIPIETKDFTWNVGFNATYQKVKITNLSLVKDASSPGTYAGPLVGSRNLQIMTEGYTPYMFFVYKQIYDQAGKPIEGAYADLNDDKVINDKDLYRYHSPMPDYLLGFNTQLAYKKWSLGFALRASLGNYVYNNMNMNLGAWETMQYVSSALNNLSTNYLKTGFQTRQYYSDYYVENASFLKMDNISLGYDFGRVLKLANIRVGALVQNVFTITNYSGVDPEVSNGFDSQFYPRPRTFSLSVNLDF
nr:TonB-dependent receptor [uncultured Bacteroides sp.]